MANNDWNSFMQGKMAKMILNGLCAVMCAAYAIDAIREMVTGGSPLLIEQVGTTAYYALTVARIAVCAWASFAFGRATVKTMSEEDK